VAVSDKPGPRQRGRQDLHEKVRTARGRRSSSTRWLQRQLNDPYVAEARRQNYRSRAAFKLLQLDEKFAFLKPGRKVVDLGAAPGGWTQVAVAACGAGNVLALDINPMEAVTGARFACADMQNAGTPDLVHKAMPGGVDIVLSDMAAPATGHRQTDHWRIMALCEVALDLAEDILNPGGVFVAKVLKGGTEQELLARLKRNFSQVKHAKPGASRADSSESYVVASGFRGPAGGNK